VSRRSLAALFAVALIVRLSVIAATPGYVPRHDDHDYDRLAWAMASGEGYPPVRIRGRLYAVAYRPPLWPAALGAGYAVTGHRVLAGRVENALLGALGVLALTWVAFSLLGPRAARWAGAIGAVYLPLALMASVLESETLFVLCELVAVGCGLHARRSRSWAAAAGAAVGLAALARVDGLVLLAGVQPLAGVRRAALVLAACIVVIAPWTVRNAVRLHAFVPITTEAGATLAGTYNAASMHDSFAPGSWVLLRHTPDLQVVQHHLSPVAQDAALRRAALRFVARHPAYPLAVAAQNLRRWLDLAGLRRARFEAQTADIPPAWADAAVPFAWVLAGLALAGAGAVRRRPALWLGPAALLLVTLFVNAETPRFRAPLDPFLILLAAAFLAQRVQLRPLRHAAVARRLPAQPPQQPRAEVDVRPHRVRGELLVPAPQHRVVEVLRPRVV
jgi:4-amino-4-deoxy-L-arabinose transferase-like glycosyltransferase